MADTVREAVIDDLPGILPLALQMAAQHASWDRRRFTTDAPALPAYQDWIPELIARNDAEVFVAERDSEIVAYLIAERYDERAHEWSSSHVYIMDVAVRPDARRTGVAQALAQRAVEWAHGQGVRQVRALTATCNDRARNLFFALGFRPTAVELSLDL